MKAEAARLEAEVKEVTQQRTAFEERLKGLRTALAKGYSALLYP